MLLTSSPRQFRLGELSTVYQSARKPKLVALCFLVGLFCLTSAWLFIQTRHEVTIMTPPTVTPALRGQEATDFLKQQGTYASLQEAITATQYQVVAAEEAAKLNTSMTAEGSYVASNPQQGYQTIFTPEQIVVTPHAAVSQASGKRPTWQLGLKLTGYGYGRRLSSVTPGLMKTHGNRVEIARSPHRQANEITSDSPMKTQKAALLEWYVNRPDGLEQGYTVAERPQGGMGDEPMRLRMELSGSLRPLIKGTTDSIAFLDQAGTQILSYDHLVVTDRNGQRLASHFEVSDSTVSIAVADAGATYPVTIDPTLTQQAYLKASNTESGDFFGYSVAVSGDTVVVGTRREDSNATGVNGNQNDNSAVDSGAAYVFVRSGGTWSQEGYLKASNTEAGDDFGWSVAVSGDTVVVGARLESSNAAGVNGNQNDNSATSSGAAYVFVRSGGTWSQQAYLKASNPDGGDQFGAAIAASGDTIVVGAFEEDSNATGINGNQSNNSSSGAGAAYVFERSGGTWSQQAYLKASNTNAADWFGYSVALSGDTVVVGARNESSNATGVNGNQADNSAVLSGAAYVFVRSGGIWSQQAYLKASNTETNDFFGRSLAVSGDTVVVGAVSEASSATGVNGNQSDNSASGAGSAYVFERSGGTWSQQAYLKASNTEADDGFAESVAVSGDTVVVGAACEDSNATGVNGSQANNFASCAGAAYVFERSGVTWSQQSYLKASNTEAGDGFGVVVAVSGSTVVVAALDEASNATGVNGNQSNNSAPTSGAVYVFAPLADSDGDGVLDGADNCPFNPNPDQLNTDGDAEGDACDPDDDNDTVPDGSDNCPLNANTDQADGDGDGIGTACDPNPNDGPSGDIDGDGVVNNADNCPNVSNTNQFDTDLDNQGDACDADDDNDGVVDANDNCPLVSNSDQANTDGDALGDVCDPDDDNDGVLDGADNCPFTANPSQANNDGDSLGDVCDPDDDNDGVPDGADNCPFTANPGQANNDGDILGDVCDPDDDNDGVLDGADNCQFSANPGQANNDGDTLGDVCDPDDDNDGVPDGADNCPFTANPGQANNDGDTLGDVCDPDDDNDGVPDGADNCPFTANPSQANNDGDALGDVCDPDDDNDGVPDGADNCPFTANPSQANNDGDTLGDVCDPDDDNDGVPDGADNCPFTANPSQANNDGDTLGDVCDPDDDNDGVPDASDNCPLTPNSDQLDTNGDGVGDACTPFQFPDDVQFVIGDQVNQAAGATVYFWGSQWSNNNPMSGGSGPNSFKGFENGSPLPTCGSTWTSRPGNSSNPPATIPQYMAVIVSSSVVKNGSILSGDVKKIIVVETNAGYSAAPGHSGSGKVVAIVCSSP